MPDDFKICSRCETKQPVEEFHFASRATGERRNRCKSCISDIRSAQRDPNWRPQCKNCGEGLERRPGPGPRLCTACFAAAYEGPSVRKLAPCRACNAPRLRENHVKGTQLCEVCRSFSTNRRSSLKNTFNITPREYVQLLEFQNFVCAICKNKPRKTFHVDHKHGLQPNNIIRGLLCSRCNTLISTAKDSPEMLRNAADFLEQPPAQILFPGRFASADADNYTVINQRYDRKKKTNA